MLVKLFYKGMCDGLLYLKQWLILLFFHDFFANWDPLVKCFLPQEWLIFPSMKIHLKRVVLEVGTVNTRKQCFKFTYPFCVCVCVHDTSPGPE